MLRCRNGSSLDHAGSNSHVPSALPFSKACELELPCNRLSPRTSVAACPVHSPPPSSTHHRQKENKTSSRSRQPGHEPNEVGRPTREFKPDLVRFPLSMIHEHTQVPSRHHQTICLCHFWHINPKGSPQESEIGRDHHD